MSFTAEEIERHALALPLRDRAQLVDKLWESLGDTSYPILSESWKKEIECRRKDLESGKAKAVPGPEVSRKAWEIAAVKQP